MILSVDLADMNDLSRWRALLKPPSNYLSSGHHFVDVEIAFAKDYPNTCPRVVILATDSERDQATQEELKIKWNEQMAVPQVLEQIQ